MPFPAAARALARRHAQFVNLCADLVSRLPLDQWLTMGDIAAVWGCTQAGAVRRVELAMSQGWMRSETGRRGHWRITYYRRTAERMPKVPVPPLLGRDRASRRGPEPTPDLWSAWGMGEQPAKHSKPSRVHRLRDDDEVRA